MKMCSSSSVLSVSLCLLLCLSPCLSSEVSLAVKVKPGEDVTLPCPSSGKAEVVLIQWTRPDLTSEGYIFHYRDGRFQNHSQHQSYRGRVELKDPEMKDGDVSVVLKNINFSDTGRYECLVGNKGNKPKLISNITLIVQDSVTIRAEPGQSVSLPCRAPRNTDILAAEWTRPELEPEYVLTIRDKILVLDDQHPSYQNRVELKDREMKDGDVSIILKNVTRDDAGTYECRVFHNEAESSSGSTLKNEPISIVHLQVHQSGDKEENIGDKEGGVKEGGNEGLYIVLGVGLTLLVVVVVYIFYRKHKKPSPPRPDII